VTCARCLVVVMPEVELWRPGVATGLVVAVLDVVPEPESEVVVDWESAVVVVPDVVSVTCVPGLVVTAR